MRSWRIGPIVVAAVAAAWSGSGPTAWAAPCWPPPVAAAIADPFRRPACRWCPGNRGIEYSTPAGTLVRSVAPGTVSFAGSVAGVAYVVVELPNGWRLTYGNLAARTVARGAPVLTGTVLGATAGRLHLGLRGPATDAADEYLDPSPYLGRWRIRPRLVPVGGGPARPAPPPTLTCSSRAIG